MKLSKLHRYQYLEELIRKRKTGNSTELSQKLGVSCRHAYRMIDELKLLGAEIVYSKEKRSFEYIRPCQITIDVNIRFLDEDEIKEINGGFNDKNNFLTFFVNYTG